MISFIIQFFKSKIQLDVSEQYIYIYIYIIYIYIYKLISLKTMKIGFVLFV